MCSNSAFGEIYFELARHGAQKIDVDLSLSRDEYMRFENEHNGSQTDESVVGMKFKNEIDTRSDKNGVINQREITLITNRI